MYFPCTHEKPKSTRNTRAVSKAKATGEVVLLVEDEDALRGVIRQVLEDNGYHLLTARNGPDAVRVSQEHAGTIHLVLTDVVMPQMNGYDLARRLTADRPDIKTIFMSGYTDSTVIRNGVVNAGLVMLQKPFRTEDLVARVREVLGGSAPEFHVKPLESGTPEAVGQHNCGDSHRTAVLQGS